MSGGAGAEPIDFHGLPAIRWRSRDGAAAIATLQGAHLVSWIPSGGREMLFVSERSPFSPGRAIRGGVPVCFPQFADRGPLPQHGFARVQPWTHAAIRETTSAACATFVLQDTPETRQSWPHAFLLQLDATVGGEALELRMTVRNTGETPFALTTALHTYLKVNDARTASLRGLQGVRFLTRGERAPEVEPRESVTAAQPIDRIYFSPPSTTRLSDGARLIDIAQAGFTDTVVWNPGAERAAQMADMAPGGWRRMLCVEAAAIEPRVDLQPASDWTGSQRISIRAA